MIALKILGFVGAAFVLGLLALARLGADMELYRRDLDGFEVDGDWLFDVVPADHDNAGAA